MSFADLKKDAKRSLNPHFGYYVLLFLPIFILQVAIGFLQIPVTNSTDVVLSFSGIMLVLSILVEMLTVGVMFVLIDHGRNLRDYSQATSRSFTVFSTADYFWGVVGLELLIGLYTFLWSLLLFVPGIIKGYSYSQAIYIYRDHLDQGNKIGFNQAITESREMMNGHKAELFVLQLSFIGWIMLCFLVIPAIWVMPYYAQTLANFYVSLSAAEKPKADDDLVSIAQ